MTVATKPKADPKAPFGSRSWAAALLAEFGSELGTEYFNRQLSFDEAQADYERRTPRKRLGFAARIGRSAVMQRQQPPAEPEAKPATGFAAKFRLPGEERAPATPREAPQRRLDRNAVDSAAPPVERLVARRPLNQEPADDGELKYAGFATKLKLPGER